jgi:RNA polymerase sigma-70 factor (ECF subfamily)
MEISHDADEWLMAQVALGHREQLARLMHRYAGPLLTFIQRMGGDPHRSEELFQEVFLRVWTHRTKYRFPRSFRSWLFAIAANHCRTEYRKRVLPVVSLDAADSREPQASGASPMESAISTETSQLVAEAVRQLPARQRAVVVMRVWNGMSYAEIADVLTCGEATVRSHMHHGLATIRRFLEPRI